MRDFLTERTINGNYDLPPHGILVLDESHAGEAAGPGRRPRRRAARGLIRRPLHVQRPVSISFPAFAAAALLTAPARAGPMARLELERR